MNQEANYWVWEPNHNSSGPMPLDALVAWVREKRVGVATWIYSSGSQAWSQAGTIAELRPLFKPAHGGPGHLVGAFQAGVNPDVMLRIRALAGMEEAQLQAFVQYMEILDYAALAPVVREGEQGDAMFLILEGEVRVSITRHDKESILATLKAGDFFGEISLLDQGPRSADVFANDHTTLLKISTDSFAKLRREAPALAELFLHSLGQILVGRLRRLNKRYVDSMLMLRALDAPGE